MRDYKHLTFNVGAEGLTAVRALFARCDVSTEAAIQPEGTDLIVAAIYVGLVVIAGASAV